MDWQDRAAWNSSQRQAFAVDGFYEGYEKKHNNFAFYWVNRAGHMILKILLLEAVEASTTELPISFTRQEGTDIHFCYGVANGDSAEAAKE
nr:unnamed protein product [Callosobruchus analis]